MAISELPLPLYDAAKVKALDQTAINTLGISATELMQKAGAFAFACMQNKWPNPETITVICGSGNNGGDGYVLASLAAKQGAD